VGGIDKTIDRASIESCGAPQSQGATRTDDKKQEWAGVPLYYLVGSVDDEIEHEGPAFNRTLAEAGYTIDVVAADGYTVTFEAARVQYNRHILVAYKVNQNQLPDEYFPLRLVGDDLQKNEMVGAIAELKVGVELVEVVATEAPTEAAAASSEDVTGSLVIVGAVDQPLGFTEADLRALEVVQLTAEHPKKGMQDYEGVSLNALLDMAGISESATALVFTASDGYVSEVALSDVRACPNCLLAFTEPAQHFNMVMPDLPSSAWAKDVVKIEVK
jgi:DMSO/TMAO reductase YedYZ molybdopterin-dependent catalytic subunit